MNRLFIALALLAAMLQADAQNSSNSPQITITSPTPGQNVADSFVLVAGTTQDNGQVTNVFCQINGGYWFPAVTTNNWINWTTYEELETGTNTVSAYAVDSLGNISATNSVSFNCSAAGLLTVEINGDGTVSPDRNGDILVPGRNYTLRAIPDVGFILSNWSGSLSSVKNPLTFTMQSNMVLQANFVTNPFIPVAGIYQGLCMNATNVTLATAGSFKATVGNKGAFTANLVLAGRSHPFSGQFSAAGLASNVVTLARYDYLTVLLQLDFASTNILTGTVSNSAWSSDILAYRSKLYSVEESQKYTVAISGSGSTNSAQPGGDGFGLLTVNTAGNATFFGVLADNTTVTETAPVSQGGYWPFYVPLYAGKGMIIGWFSLTNGTSSDVNAQLTWIKEPQRVAYYPGGFTNQPQAVGSLYAYTNYFPILNLSNAVFYLTGGNPSAGLTNDIILIDTTVICTNPTLRVTFTPSLGRFQGTVANPVPGDLPARLSFKGAVLQKQDVAVGFYLGDGQSSVAGIGLDSSGEIFDNGATYLLTVTTAGTGSGTVAAHPSGPTYLDGSVVTLTGAPTAGSTFVGWLGDLGGSGATTQITMDTNEFVTAVFDLISTTPTPSYSLTLGTAGTGAGTVTANPPGPIYTSGTGVTLTATPAAGSTFAAWSGGATGTGTSTGITMNTNQLVVGVFDLVITNANGTPTYSLALGTTGTGGGTVTASPPGPFYTNGTVVTLTETPDSISTFSGWFANVTGSGASVQITMSTNQLVIATFTSLPTFSLALGTAGAGSGTISANPPGLTYLVGTVVTLTETPGPDSTFTGWSGDATGTGTSVQVTMSTNRSVTGTFAGIPTYTLTIATDGTGSGTVTANPPGPAYTNGTEVTLTAMPASGSGFAGWSGGASGTAASTQIEITGDTDVTATFNTGVVTGTDYSGTWIGQFNVQYLYYPNNPSTAVQGSRSFNITIIVEPGETIGEVSYLSITNVSTDDAMFGCAGAGCGIDGSDSSIVLPLPPENVSTLDEEGITINFPNGCTLTTSAYAGALHMSSDGSLISNAAGVTDSWQGTSDEGQDYLQFYDVPVGYRITSATWSFTHSAQ